MKKVLTWSKPSTLIEFDLIERKKRSIESRKGPGYAQECDISVFRRIRVCGKIDQPCPQFYRTQ